MNDHEQHFTGNVAVKAIIVQDGKILMTRDNNDTDIWDFPGGRINLGENIETALVREVKEELGVDVKFDSLVASTQVVHTFAKAPHLFITCKVIMLDPDQKFKVPSEEIAEIKWVDAHSELTTYDSCKAALAKYWSINS